MDGHLGLLTKADGVRDRDAERFAVAVPVRLKPEGVRVITVGLSDISTTGLMVRRLPKDTKAGLGSSRLTGFRHSTRIAIRCHPAPPAALS